MEESTQIEPQKFTLNTAIWVAIKSQLFGVLIMIVPIIILFIVNKDKTNIEPSQMPFFNTIVFISVTLGEYLVIRKTMKTLGLTGFPLKKLSVFIVFLLIAFVLFGASLIGEFTSFLNLPDIVKWHEMSKFDIIIGGIILAPILEEILFRGIILEGLLRTYSQEKAIAFSAIIFGIIHFNPPQIVGATIIGFFLGWLYVKSKSILPSIMVHFFNNSLAFLPQLLGGVDMKKWEEETLYSVVGNVWLYILLIIASITILYFVIKTLNNKWSNPMTE